MRRSDRQVPHGDELREILEKCKVCRIAFLDSEGIYIVPMNFGYSYEGEKLTLYFHGATGGRRAEILKAGDISAGFEMDCDHQLLEDDDPCEYSYRYSSIIGTGTAKIITGPAEKELALNALMLHQTGKTFDFRGKPLDNVLVFKITSDSFTGKRLK